MTPQVLSLRFVETGKCPKIYWARGLRFSIPLMAYTRIIQLGCNDYSSRVGGEIKCCMGDYSGVFEEDLIPCVCVQARQTNGVPNK